MNVLTCRGITLPPARRLAAEHALHAYAGSGKTSAAAEFARWLAETGGLAGPVLFTSFEQHKPLPRVLDELKLPLNVSIEADEMEATSFSIVV